MIVHELPRQAGRSDSDDQFVAEALRCQSRYGHFWTRSVISPLERLRRPGLFLVDDTRQEIGAFKIRGASVAVNEANSASPDGVGGVCAASSGSFGMGIASTSHRLGLECTIFMPANASEKKKQRIRSFGAVVDDTEPTYEAAKQKARGYAAQRDGRRFIDGVGWEVFKGNATLAAEVVDSGALTRSRSAVIVPLGIGSLAIPMSLFLRGSGFESDVFVVEPLTHCKFLADLDGEIRPSYADTIADGAAVRAIPDLARGLLGGIARAVLALTEEEIVRAMRRLWESERIQSEGAGALALGAFLARPELFDDYEQVWMVVTGRNIASSQFQALIEAPKAFDLH